MPVHPDACRCLLLLLIVSGLACKKKAADPIPDVIPSPLVFTTARLDNNIAQTGTNYNVRVTPAIRLSFNNVVDRTSVASAVTVIENSGISVGLNYAYENGDSTLLLTPAAPLKYLATYTVAASTALRSAKKGTLNASLSIQFLTSLDSSNKFPVVTDSALLTLVQQQTFKYFWDFGHPVSGLARERNTSADVVTSGGSGFGIMAIPVAINRNFITRAQGLTRMQTMVAFLKNTAQTFHGAYPHWLNGNTGVVVPFSTKDDGADLVETSYLMEGLLTARQFFNGADVAETNLRNDINVIWNRVEWNWFRQGSQNTLFWHWSPNYNWDMNVQVRGWNEALITYVMAAASTSYTIPKTVYDNGWAGAGGFANGNTYYGYQLPLGPNLGGPLFFEHYSFMGINPNGLSDGSANYGTQTKNHTLINYNYCKANPKAFYGYSNLCWGLTASDIQGGYTASSPTNDVGTIAPTAALSSFPYTPIESMQALKFFYYVLGDRIWKEYGFVDAFDINDGWFASSTLAIDQGPIIVMIENYRSGLAWNLFTSCPEVKAGLIKLGFTAPYL
ncbi:MAG: glucoamylase family protein [Chitinophagaceae bacterium]